MPKPTAKRGREPVPAAGLFDDSLASLPPAYGLRLKALAALNREADDTARRSAELQARVADAQAARTDVVAAEHALRTFLFEVEVDGSDDDGSRRAALRQAVTDARVRATDVSADEAELVQINDSFRALQAQRGEAQAGVVAAMGEHLARILYARVIEAETIASAIEHLAAWSFRNGRVELGIALRAGTRAPMATEADPGALDRFNAERLQRVGEGAKAWINWPDVLLSDVYADPGNMQTAPLQEAA